jgi:predicted DNA-binding protein (UPF0251 family)
VNSDTPDLPLTDRMAEALRLHDEGLSNGVIAQRMNVNNRRVSDLLRAASLRTGRPITHRRSPTPPQDLNAIRYARMEARMESMRQRMNRLERELAAVQRRLPVVESRRLADQRRNAA